MKTINKSTFHQHEHIFSCNGVSLSQIFQLDSQAKHTIVEYQHLLYAHITSLLHKVWQFSPLENGRFWLIPLVIKMVFKGKGGVIGRGKEGSMQTSQWLILAWDISPLMGAGRGAYWLIAAGGVRVCTFTFWWIGCQGCEQPNMAP